MLINSEGHLACARRFEQFLATLPAESPYAEWKIIVLFYSALHYVEAFLVTKSRQYRDHVNRDPEMGRWEATKAVREPYNKLRKCG